jgi:hypothetical protein
MAASAGTIIRESSRPVWSKMVLLLPLCWWTLALGLGYASWCFLDYVNLAFHEAGHLGFSAFGKTLHYLGGSLGQLLVPFVLALNFLIRERNPFAAACCLWWVGQSTLNISIYMADARSLALPLVGGGDHDWNELFYRMGLLAEPAVQRVSQLTHLMGCAVMLTGLAWACYFVIAPLTRERVTFAITCRWPALAPFFEA